MNNEYICRVTQKIVDKCQIQLSLFHNISIHEMKSNWIEPPTYFEAIYIYIALYHVRFSSFQLHVMKYTIGRKYLLRYKYLLPTDIQYKLNVFHRFHFLVILL